MEDDNSMTHKILCQLEDLTNRPYIKEFTIVPTTDNTTNKSPVLFEEFNIGLESWCVKHVYRHACRDLFLIRKKLTAKKLPPSTLKSINRLLVGAILINPECSTFWNMKRELIECNALTTRKELDFTAIVLSSKSKSNEAFSYRRWLLRRILDKISLEVDAVEFFNRELVVTKNASEKAENNYFACNHAIWCIENIGKKLNNFSETVYRELEANYNWLLSHVSEHTGYHYRQYLFKIIKYDPKLTFEYSSFYEIIARKYGIECSGRRQLLQCLLGRPKNPQICEVIESSINYIGLLLFDLFDTIEKLNKYYPDHEALWYHRRFIIYQLVKVSYEYLCIDFQKTKVNEIFPKTNVDLNIVYSAVLDCLNVSESGVKEPKIFKTQPNKFESTKMCKMLVSKEKEFIGENSCSDSSLVQTELAKKHQIWLKFVLGFDLDSVY